STVWPAWLASAAVVLALSAWGVWRLNGAESGANSATDAAVVAERASDRTGEGRHGAARAELADARAPVTSSAATNTRKLRLVDETGAPLVGFGVRTEVGERVSDADGIVELPAMTERLETFDDAR